MRSKLLLSLFATTLSASAIADEANTESTENTAPIETVTVIGSAENAKTLSGSGSVVDNSQWLNESITDINQALKTVPGIYIREEDGFGLRPNIGIRGATAERSEKITLLEDGILAAPAPYSNPAAYYFPTAKRMHSIEVLKGAPLLRHGPQTTGGVVNLISTPIPEQQSGTVAFSLNNRSSFDFLANFGTSIESESGTWGFLFETVQRNYNGYKDIDRSERDAGFELQDYVGKISWSNDEHTVLLKLQRSEEESNETYLGLTDADFKKDANRRYGLSDIDVMNNTHEGASLTHIVDFSDTLSVSTSVYHNEFKRDWFKLSGGNKYINQANAGDASAQGILDGTTDVSGLKYKHNNREYISQGIQSNINWLVGDHELDFGARVHHDEMDRFQPQEIFNQVNGQLIFQSITAPTGSNNREEEADAISLWLIDSYQATDALLLNFALRYEDIETKRTQYDDEDRNIVDSKRSNSSRTWLPGLSATYNFTDTLQGLVGYHKGLSPLGGGAKENEEPEESDNIEAGIRFNSEDDLFVEFIAFHSDFSNKTEQCSVGAVCSNGADSGSYSVGGATISGLEFQLSSGSTLGSFYIPVNMAYTYTKGEVKKDDTTEGIAKGDQLKDIPENTFSFRTGLEHKNGWNNYLVAKYTDELCVSIGCNNNNDKFDRTQSLFTVDLISRYTFAAGPEVFLKVENVFDEQSIVSRNPDGARPNLPLTATAGIRYDF